MIQSKNQEGHCEIVKLLIEAGGGDLNLTPESEFEPLFVATRVIV